MKNWKTIWETFTRQKSAFRLVLIGAAGLLMLAVAGLFPAAGQTEPAQEGESSQAAQRQAYARDLEENLQDLIGRMDGAGETLVMVTLEEGENYVYVTDEKYDESRQNYETEHVLYSTGGGSAPLLETTYMPTVRGVAILCEGGEDARVVSKITETVSALLNLGTNRISVAKIN